MFAHAEVQVGDSVIMVSDANDMFGPTKSNTHVYVEDSDAVFARALQAGARSVTPMETMFYGDRSGNVEDRWGNRWTISTHVEEVSDEEMMKRMSEMAPA